VVSKGDARRGLFGRSFDMRGKRLIEMYHHHHEQHIVSGIPAHHRRPPPSTGPGLSATYLYLTFRHAGVYPRDRKWSNLSRSIHRVATLNISPVPLMRRRGLVVMQTRRIHVHLMFAPTVHITTACPSFLTVSAASYRSAPFVTPCPVHSHLDFLRRAQRRKFCFSYAAASAL
jgi:hypothetical protein